MTRSAHQHPVSNRGLRDVVYCLHDIHPVPDVAELLRGTARALVEDERIKIMLQSERDSPMQDAGSAFS